MNTKRLFFWGSFIIILGLIIWGLIVAMNKPKNSNGRNLGSPAPISSLDHVTGPSDAPVTIIEYSDFQCPACEMYYYVVEKLLASSTVPIRLVYRHYPLVNLHPNAVPAAIASEAASNQGKFWEMYRLLFEGRVDWEELKDPSTVFNGYAEKLGLDVEKFKAESVVSSSNTKQASSTLKSRIDAYMREGNSIGVDSTPTFFINGKVITNPPSYAEFKTIIDEAAKASSK